MNYSSDKNGRVTRANEVILNEKKYNYIIVSDIGQSREENQDSFLSVSFVFYDKAYILSFVCDGMGGYKHGREASRMITKSITTILETIKINDEQELLRAIERAIRLSNLEIIKEYRGESGSTVVGVLFDGSNAYWWNVGDSRLYTSYKDNDADLIKKASKDHSVMQEYIDSGKLDEEDSKNFKKANILTRAVGTNPSLNIDFGLEVSIGNLLLCSDGFWHHTEREEFKDLLLSSNSEEIIDKLENHINILLDRGENDNITAILIKEEKKQ